MKKLTRVLWLVLWFCPSLLSAQSTFWLRNSDSSATFLYWTSDKPAPGAIETILPSLPLSPGGIHPVAPGERVQVTLDPGFSLVGVFLPAEGNLTFQTVLNGGFLLTDEVPAKGTVLVDRTSFQNANRGRPLVAPLQAWNLIPPTLLLDGKVTDWKKITPLLEWGPTFQPAGTNWPSSLPRPVALRVVDRNGVFWLWLAMERPLSPRATATSLVLRRPGAFLEWPLTGPDPTVWSWVEGAEPVAVGSVVRRGPDLEAWIPWDRLSGSERVAWANASTSWALLVSEGTRVRTLELGSFDGEFLP